MLIRVLSVRFFDVSGISVGVISPMVEEELGKRNFGFDFLKSRLNSDMEEKGIVTRDCFPPDPRCLLPATASASATGSAAAAGYIYRQAPPPQGSTSDIYNPIVSCRSPAASAMGSAAGLRQETIAGNNSFLLHVEVQSVLQIDVEVEEPETSENPTVV